MSEQKPYPYHPGDYLYDSWEDAISDCIADAAGDAAVSSYENEGDDFIPYDNFDILENQIIKYLKDAPGLYIFYFRPKKLWRSFLKLFKKKGE